MSTAAKALAERAKLNDIPDASLTGRSRRRNQVGVLILTLAVIAALVLGVWGFLSSLAGGASPARIGESIEVSDGLVRVDRVTPEHLAPMQMGKFAKQGMNMSMPNMDMAPKGQRRFAVDVSLIASGGSFKYSAKDFQISAGGFEEVGPIRYQLASGTLENGDAISGILVFQAPENAKDLTLTFDGGRRIALDPPSSEGGANGESFKDEGHDH